MIAEHHISTLMGIVGPKGATTENSELQPFVTEWRDKFVGQTALMLSPKNTQEVAAIVQYCAANNIAIVPQGGNTGLVGGSIPGIDGANEILLSTRRMTAINNVDAEDYSITAQAGCTIAALQAAAADVDRLFALSLASEGSCTAGGVASTNAGGVHVVRYGTTRALVLGIEAVMPDGSIIDELSSLRKDNTGYALSPLLVGAEGTLGIITKVCFQLFPSEKKRATAWLAVPSTEAALSLLTLTKDIVGNQLSVFELMGRQSLEFAFTHLPHLSDPLDGVYPWYVLLEAASSNAQSSIDVLMEEVLSTALERGMVTDGALSQSEKQRRDFWRIRESLSEAQKHEGGSIKHDISVPLSQIPAFIDAATAMLVEAYPGVRVTPFGHMGDGNLHFNVMQPPGQPKETFLAQWEAMNMLVHDMVIEFGGSISAEHGIGILKKAELARTQNPSNLAAMRAIKKALDPKNIMNPRALF